MDEEVKTLRDAMRLAWTTAFVGLASQGWRRAVDASPSERCVWRMPCDDAPRGALRCAVGWLIPDEALAPDHDGGDVALLMSYPALAIPALRPWVRDMTSFLCSLQDAHDEGRSPAEVRAAMVEVGRIYDLGPAPEVE